MNRHFSKSGHQTVRELPYIDLEPYLTYFGFDELVP